MSPSNSEPLASSAKQPQQGAAQQSEGAAVPQAVPIQAIPPVQVPTAVQYDAASVESATVPVAKPADVSEAAPSTAANSEFPQKDLNKGMLQKEDAVVEQASEQHRAEDDNDGADRAQQPPAVERPHVSAKNTTRASASDQIPDPIKKAKRKRLIKRVVIAMIALLVAVAIGIAAFSVWTIWYRFDDTADIQGTWVNSEGVSVTFDASQMHLQSGVSFNYTLNPETKEIDYSFSRSSGHGVYRFAQDRSILIIDEKGKTDWLLILEAKEDPAVQGTRPEGVTVFRRAS